MRLTKTFLPALLVACGVVSAAPAPQDTTVVSGDDMNIDDFQDLAIQTLEAAQKKRAVGTNNIGKCTLANARVRRDWEYLSKPERKEYIRAVQCLWKLPTRNPEFSAAQNYFDDFVAVHVNQTDYIHETGNFLTWHRYLMHLWEEALRNECGYKGTLPYWNWFKHQDDLNKSPVFDGSDTSLGGDGEFFAHNGSIAGNGLVWLPSGAGGGCVKSGPFMNFTINLGPVRPAMRGYEPTMPNQLSYNPRCPRRDLTMAASATFTAENLRKILTGEFSHTVQEFQEELQGPLGTLRMHGAGHYAMGGDGSDVFSSLNDPAFYLHHAMLDRVYWIWQILHPCQAKTISGTRTFRNNIPSDNATVDDLLDMKKLGPALPIKDMFDTLSGSPLCYIYL